jgi:hypothetical protein
MSSGTWCHVVWQIVTNVSEEPAASGLGSSTLKMELAYFSQTSVTIYETTQLHIPEDSDLQRHQSENLKPLMSQTFYSVVVMNMKTG